MKNRFQTNLSDKDLCLTLQMFDANEFAPSWLEHNVH